MEAIKDKAKGKIIADYLILAYTELGGAYVVNIDNDEPIDIVKRICDDTEILMAAINLHERQKNERMGS